MEDGGCLLCVARVNVKWTSVKFTGPEYLEKNVRAKLFKRGFLPGQAMVGTDVRFRGLQ